MSSKTITQNDLTNILNEIFPATSDDMTPAQIEDFVQSLNAVATSSVDYIVEQGQEGIWTYRKWNSGIAECWGAPVVSSGTYTVNINLPFSFINKTSMCVQLTPLESGTSWNINYASSTTSQINFGRTPNTATNNYYMYVMGTWK